MKIIKINEKNEYVKNIRKKINELDIKSEKEWDEFVKKEEMAQVYSEKWLQKIKSMAERGDEINIDLKQLPSEKRIRAKILIRSLDAEIRTLTTGTPVGYSDVYKIISILTALISLIYGVSGVLRMFEITDENKNKLFLKHIKNIPNAKKDSPVKIINWIKSLVSMIKK